MASVEILIAPYRESAGDEWLSRLAQYLGNDRSRSALCIVPTGDAARRLEERLLLDCGVPGLLGAPIRTFYQIARDIAEKTKLGSHNLSDLQRSLLLQDIAANADIPTLARVQRFPGFPAALGDLIGELKLAMIRPEDLGRAIEKLPRAESALRAKLRDLLTLYGRYQEMLTDHDLHDAEGLMWHAVSELEKDPETLGKLSVVFFDGFRNFNEVQLRLIGIIADSVGEVFVRLNHDPSRAEAFASCERTVAGLRVALGCEPRIAVPRDDEGALAHIAANIFREEAKPKPPDSSLVFLEAGSPGLEADEVARQIKLLVAGGEACYSDIAIITRGPEAYEQFAHALARHDVPVRQRRERLAASAAGRALTESLRVIREGWPAPAVGALLKSPCLPGDPRDRARAEVNAWQQGVHTGREPWFAKWPDDDTVNAREQALGRVRDLEQRLRGARDVGEIAAAVREFLADLQRASGTDLLARRHDDAAQAKLDALVGEVEFIGRAGRTALTWESFCEHIERAVAEATYDANRRRAEGVAVLDAQRLGGEVYRIVFVVNLLEKVFPAQVREDPFLRDRERRLLAAVDDRIKLDLAYDRQAEERLLFWRAVSCAGVRLYLSYPTADEKAKDSLPSFYINEVERLFDPKPERLGRDFSDQAPAPARAVSAQDWAACILHGLARDLPASAQATHAAHYNAWLGRDEKRPAECASPAPPYADALADRELLAALESRDRPYSPAELERYLICPYLYYCEKLLELQPLEREIAPVDYGLLLHDVLARLYRDLHEQGRGAVDVAALDPEQVVARAWELLDECLMRQPRFANLPGAQRDIERQSLHGILTRFLCADLEQTAKRDLRPAYFELQFGSPRRSSADERSQPGPLDLGTTGERSVLIAGRMDRVDLTPEGAALIVDYKLGKDTPDMRGVKDGLLFQAPLYAMAAREIFGLDLAGAEYVSLRSGERKGMYRDPSLPLRKSGHNLILSDDDFDATLTGAANAARACIERIRRGEMPRGPRDECPTYCAYRSICRMDAWTLRRIQAERGTRDAG